MARTRARGSTRRKELAMPEQIEPSERMRKADRQQAEFLEEEADEAERADDREYAAKIRQFAQAYRERSESANE
jgi:hypothetical protein